MVDNALIVVILAEDAVKVVVVVMALVGSAGLSIWMGPGIVGPALAKTSRSARPGPDLGMQATVDGIAKGSCVEAGQSRTGRTA